MSLLVWLFEAFQVISEKKIHKILIIAPTFQPKDIWIGSTSPL